MPDVKLPPEFQDQNFSKEGMYLLFPNGQKVSIVPDEIENLSAEYWENPEKIHPKIKELEEFKPCGHCPHHGEDVLCLALRPILPYLENVDHYMSYDRCVAVFSTGDGSAPTVQETSTQQALRYVAILSMIHYCEMGGRYRKYFAGVHPMMETNEISRVLFDNLKKDCAATGKDMEETATHFEHEVMESTVCLTTRLKLMCQNDAFVNAFINAQTAIKFVLMDCQDEKYNEGESR